MRAHVPFRCLDSGRIQICVVRLLVGVMRWLADTTDNMVLENIDTLFMEWLDRCIDWSVEHNENK